MKNLLIMAVGVLLGIVCSMISLIILAYSDFALPSLRVGELVLVDDSGKILAGLSSTEEHGSRFVIIGANNRASIEICVDDNSSSMQFSDGDGTQRVIIKSTQQAPKIELFDMAGKPLPILGTQELLRARRIEIVDEDDLARIEMTAQRPSGQTVNVGDSEYTVYNDSAAIEFVNQNEGQNEGQETPLLRLTVNGWNMPTIEMFGNYSNKEGEVLYPSQYLRIEPRTISMGKNIIEPRLMLTYDDDSSWLSMFDTKRTLRQLLKASAQYGTSFGQYDEYGNLRVLSNISDSKPRINVLDKEGIPRALLGVAQTVNKKTGTETTTAESTLTLFDSEGTVLTQLPLP